jgi:hypothetical protein
MAETRTEQQKQADDALTKAIEEGLSAYGFSDKNSLTLHYIVLVNQRIFDGGGDEEKTSIVRMYRDGRMDWTSILGLLRGATLKAEQEFQEGEED